MSLARRMSPKETSLKVRRPKVCSTSQGPKCCFEDCVDPKRPYAEKPSSAESGEREVPGTRHSQPVNARRLLAV